MVITRQGAQNSFSCARLTALLLPVIVAVDVSAANAPRRSKRNALLFHQSLQYVLVPHWVIPGRALAAPLGHQRSDPSVAALQEVVDDNLNTTTREEFSVVSVPVITYSIQYVVNNSDNTTVLITLKRAGRVIQSSSHSYSSNPRSPLRKFHWICATTQRKNAVISSFPKFKLGRSPSQHFFHECN